MRAPAFRLAAPCVILALVAAGCATPAVDPNEPMGDLPPMMVTFTHPVVIDEVRSGGEPVLRISPTGTLFIATHPGYTHANVGGSPGPEVAEPVNGASYLFRSTDGGDTWQVVGGALTEGQTPRNPAAPGVSDPDLAFNADGSRIVLVDLLFPGGVSAQASSDDGRTWPQATAAAHNPNDSDGLDRPWIAFAGDTFYLLYNGASDTTASDWRLRSSSDGITWRDHATPGDGDFPGAMVADPNSGSLYIGDATQVWASHDGGTTWAASAPLPAGDGIMDGIIAQPPAVDAAGTVYFTWSEHEAIYYAYSDDGAATWHGPIDITAAIPHKMEAGTHIWPWPAAGALGALSIVWAGANDTQQNALNVKGPWFVHHATILNANSDAPTIIAGPIPDAHIKDGGICTSGTICQATQSDRRLGDFLTNAIDAAGVVHIAYPTIVDERTISSPAYVRMSDGPLLR